MTDVQERVDVDVDLSLTPVLHHACCVEEDKFLCGHPYHSELDTDDPEDDSCSACDEKISAAFCQGRGIPHMHCPVGPRLCPTGPPNIIVVIR